MAIELRGPEGLDLWRRALCESVRRDGPDLSARQMALLLTVYLTPPPHTVRGLAEILNVAKPAVTRALDRLGILGLARRKRSRGDQAQEVLTELDIDRHTASLDGQGGQYLALVCMHTLIH